MLCTVVVVPTGPVGVMAALHITLMIMKARNEERFLLGVHGAAVRAVLPAQPAASSRASAAQRPRRTKRDEAASDPCAGPAVPGSSAALARHASGRELGASRSYGRPVQSLPAHDAALARTASLQPRACRACTGGARRRAPASLHRRALEALGLTGLVVDTTRWRFRYEGGPAQVELAVHAAGGTPLAELSRAIEREFNRPFSAAAQENPFRFLVIDEGAAFYLALAYDHFVAGGDSIARLLTGIALSPTSGSDVAAGADRSSAIRPPTAASSCATRCGRSARSSACRGCRASARRAHRLRTTRTSRMPQRHSPTSAWSRRSCERCSAQASPGG